MEFAVAVISLGGACGGALVTTAQSGTQPAMVQSSPSSQPNKFPFAPVAHIETRGSGPICMILIPGLSCDWTVFEAFMQRNASRYTMHAVTLPGFGGSAAPTTPAADDLSAWLDNATKAVWKVVEDQKLQRPVIVGHSLGGHLALRLGAEHSQDIRAVISIDGGPAFPFGQNSATMTAAQRLIMAQQMASMYSAIDAEQWAANQRTMIGMMVTDPQRAKELGDLCSKVPAQTTIRYMTELVAADIRDQLANCAAPILVLPSAGTKEPDMIQAIHKTWTDLMKQSPNAK